MKSELYHYNEWTNHIPYGEIVWRERDLSSLLHLLQEDYVNHSRKLLNDQINDIVEVTESIINKVLKAIIQKKDDLN